jgi:hypothetical protein
LTARGGDTVTALGKRNIGLVAGGVVRSILGPVNRHGPEIAQMYLPEPGGAASLAAGALSLLAVAGLARRVGPPRSSLPETTQTE